MIILQNRRGFAPFVECVDCGYCESCERCSVTVPLLRDGLCTACHLSAMSRRDTPVAGNRNSESRGGAE
jgi:primosomal protein N' (replication factor Y)